MKRRIISFLLIVAMVFNSVSSIAYATDQDNHQMFKDVSPDNWYYDSVMAAVNNDIFSGITPDTFSPDAPMTRAMYVTIMGRIAQVDSTAPADHDIFTDLVAGAYYLPYVKWAVEKGITQGTGNNEFSPDSKITREQMATFTVRFFEAYDIPLPSEPATVPPGDLEEISPWARESVMKLWSGGLFRGDDLGNFNPRSQATRAEAAVLSVRLDENLDQGREDMEMVDVRDSEDSRRSSATYYRLSFDSNGGSAMESFSRREGGDMSGLPVPYKEEAVFAGWYYDKALTRLVASNDRIRESLTLYARWGEAVPLAETASTRFASATDQQSNFSITVMGLASMTATQVKNLITVKNFNSQADVDWIKVTKSGADFIVSGVHYAGDEGSQVAGFEEGASYRVTLDDERLKFEGFPQETRDYNFTIKKADVFNVTLNENMAFIRFEDISNIQENGVDATTINATPLAVNQDGSGAGDLVAGTFTLTKGTLEPGTTVTIYEGIDPRDRKLDDTRDGADGNIAYVEITSVDGTTYAYQTADVEEVLFTPDVLPVAMDADTDGNPYNDEISVTAADMDFSDDWYADIGLDSQTTVDVGDYLSFYQGDLKGAPGPSQEGFALVTSVTDTEGGYVIAYEEVALEEVLAAMDMYNTDPVEGEKMLEDLDVAALEAEIEAQAIESGFAEEAGHYLAAMAFETKAFTEITEDFELRNYEILSQEGGPLSPEDIQLMADDGMSVKVEVDPPQAAIGTDLEHFENYSGLRLTLKITAKITIGPKNPGDGDAQVVINLTGEFEEEIHIGINIDGGARWEWWAIFPYIAEYEVTANIDIFNYTGLKFHASIVTKEYKDKKWTEDDELKNVVDELKKLVDEVKEGLGSDEEEEDPANDLIKKYQAMMETESDWVNLVEERMGGMKYNIPPIMIIEVSVAFNFVIQANMNISLGAEFWYMTAKRYTYNVEIFAGNVTSDVLDMVEEQYEFTFYVMGTLGLRAGIKVEAKISLFSEKFASVGFAAEAGAYIKMWGYFYYQLTYKASVGQDSKYAGALYFELGIYLELSFEAQAFAGTFSYNPTLYENEWPLWHAGMRENIQDFAYGPGDTPELAMKKSIQTTFVPEGLFEMLYLDLKTGDSDTKIYEDSEDYFTIEMTNDKFSYDRDKNRLTVTPDEEDIRLDGQMVISWINQPLAWTSRPISTRVDLHWDNLKNGYAIVFHSNGGSSIPIIIKRYDEALAPPADPVKKGYLFDGWYSDEALTQAYSLPQTMPNSDMEVYARWEPRSDTPYKVEHYGEILGSARYEVLDTDDLIGTTDSTVPVQTRSYEGYTTPQSREITILPDGSSVLRYYYDREIFTLTYLPGDAEGEALTSDLKYGAKITAPLLNSKGYAFTGWSPAVPAVMPAEDITFTAQWHPAEDTPYRVEYYVEQTSGKDTLQDLDDSRTGRTGSVVPLDSILREDYLLENGIVYKDTTVAGEATTAPVITKDGRLIIKVNYQRVSHEAIFDPDNGSDPETITVKYQGAISPPDSDPVKPGYVFDGWEGYAPGAVMGTGDLTYEAVWLPAQDTGYTVRHLREDLSGGYPTTGDWVESESKVGTTDSPTNAEARSYEGFRAGGFDQVTVLPDGTAEVEIKYSRISYRVDWKTEEGIYKTDQVKYGKTITAPTRNPEKEGYDFDSWQGLAEGATMGTDNLTFAAVWHPATDTAYTVRHLRQDLSGDYSQEDLEGREGTTRTPTAASVKSYEGFTAKTDFDQVIIEPDGSSVVTIYYDRNRYDILWMADGEIFDVTPDLLYGGVILPPGGIPDNKTGYTFDKWLGVPETMPAKHSSYEAGWTAKTYTVTFAVTSGAAIDTNTKEVTYDNRYGALPEPTHTGYQFVNWIDERGATVTADTTVSTPAHHELTATWAADTDVAYTVSHYQQKTEGDQYTLEEDSTQYGETDSDTAAVANTYTGFKALAFSQVKIAGDGSAEVKIYYDRREFTVSWEIDGTASTEEYRYGAGITEPDATRTGYSFEGWDVPVAATMPDHDLNYTATWKPETYSVSFDGNGGSSPDSMMVTYDAAYGALPTPGRTGHEFDGWFTSSSGGTEVVEGTTVEITSNQTLYARWTAREYTVSFDLNTGQGTAPEAITVTYDSGYGSLPVDTGVKTGYHFAGWFTAAGGGSRITSTSTVGIAQDHTLYAQWEANTYTVNFDNNGGSGIMAGQSHTYDQSRSLSPNTFIRTGHSFMGWNTMSDGSGNGYENSASVTNLATDGAVTLHALWTVNEYTLTFHSNEGSDVPAITQDYGTAVTAPADPTRTGYAFKSWDPALPATMPAENRTLTAQWRAVDYAIDYDLDGGSNHTDNPATYNIESGNIALGEAGGKTGYTFEGWYTEAALTGKVGSIAIAEGETGARTFYAKWTPNPYTVIFNKNTGDGTDSLSQDFLYDEAARALIENTFTREGYTFAGWNTKSDGTGTNYSDMQVVQNLAVSGTVSLYAKWRSVTYTVTYELGGGAQASGNPSSYTVESNDITLNDPSREGGYGFMGWYDNAAFTGGEVTTINKGSTGDKTLYAKWGFAGTFTVTNNANNTFTVTRTGNGVSSDDQHVGQQTVYFRTVNGSAIGGTHFYHQGGSGAALTFAEGETFKTVTVTEYQVTKTYEAADGKSYPATSYANIDRTYQLELVKVEGGGLLGTTTKASRTMAKDSAYEIPTTLYDYKAFASQSTVLQIHESFEDYKGTRYTGLSGSPLTGRGDTTDQKAYLEATASLMKVTLDITGEDSGWRMVRYAFFNNHTNDTTSGKESSGTLGTLPEGTKAALVYGISTDTNNTTSYTVKLPAAVGTISSTPAITQGVSVRFASYASGSGSQYVSYGLYDTVGISVATYNEASANSSYWHQGGTLYSAPLDNREPAKIGIAPMAEGDYKAGETVTIAVVFDEIVGSVNGASIIGTNLNTMTYAGGLGSNVLYFTGTVKNASNEESVLNGIALSGTVQDLVN